MEYMNIPMIVVKDKKGKVVYQDIDYNHPKVKEAMKRLALKKKK